MGTISKTIRKRIQPENLKSGVYQIFNTKTGDFYIGSSKNIKVRFQQHRRALKNKKHHSVILQRAWDKYGYRSFHFRILKYVEESKLIEIENSLFQALSPTYNIAKIAGSSRGVKHTTISSQKKREYALANGIQPPYTGKRVVMLDKDTEEEIACFRSVTDACLFVGRDGRFVSTITEICNQSNPRRKTAYGYKWRWI